MVTVRMQILQLLLPVITVSFEVDHTSSIIYSAQATQPDNALVEETPCCSSNNEPHERQLVQHDDLLDKNKPLKEEKIGHALEASPATQRRFKEPGLAETRKQKRSTRIAEKDHIIAGLEHIIQLTPSSNRIITHKSMQTNVDRLTPPNKRFDIQFGGTDHSILYPHITSTHWMPQRLVESPPLERLFTMEPLKTTILEEHPCEPCSNKLNKPPIFENSDSVRTTSGSIGVLEASSPTDCPDSSATALRQVPFKQFNMLKKAISNLHSDGNRLLHKLSPPSKRFDIFEANEPPMNSDSILESPVESIESTILKRRPDESRRDLVIEISESGLPKKVIQPPPLKK